MGDAEAEVAAPVKAGVRVPCSQGAGVVAGGCLHGLAGRAPQRCSVCPKHYAPKGSRGVIHHSAGGVSKGSVKVGVNGS